MGLKTRLISFIWGLAEATFFFLVPDIWLSRIAITNPREAYINVIIASAGAVLGGFIMYFVGLYAFEQVHQLLPLIPAIHSTMVENVGIQLQHENPLYAMQKGSVTGIPYKIYALWAGHLEMSIIMFISITTIVRSVRFTLVTILAHGTRLVLKNRINARSILRLHIFLWIVFYIFYFYKMSS